MSALSLSGCETPGQPLIQQRVEAAMVQYQNQRSSSAAVVAQLPPAPLPPKELAAERERLETSAELIAMQIALGNVFRNRNDHHRAIEYYEQALQTDPSNAEANIGLGKALQLYGQPRQATHAYATALAAEPDEAAALRGMTSALLQMGETTQALAYAQNSVTVDAQSQEAWYNLGAAYSLLQRYDEAIEAYRQAMELGDRSTAVMLGLADAHMHMRRHQQAVYTLEAMIRHSPSAVAYERLAYATLGLGQTDQAIAYYEKSLEMDINHIGALNGLGVSLLQKYFHTGRKDNKLRDRGLSAWRRSISLQPNQPRIINLIAYCSHV